MLLKEQKSHSENGGIGNGQFIIAVNAIQILKASLLSGQDRKTIIVKKVGV